MTSIKDRWSVFVAVIALSGLVVAGPGLSLPLGSVSGTIPEPVTDLLESGVQTWDNEFDGETGTDRVWANTVSPDGKRTYLTGHSWGTWEDIVTVAYDTLTGVQLWEHRYNGPGNDWDEAQDIVVSPDGSRVYVGGWSMGIGSLTDFIILAHDAETGGLLWEARYDGPASGVDWGFALAVSPDGSRVLISGSSMDTNLDYATLAFDSETGDELWVARYSGPRLGDRVNDMTISPDGERVTVTGQSWGTLGGSLSYEYATVTYDAATGQELWVARYHGGYRHDYGIAVVSDDARVYVTGQSHGPGTGADGLSWDWTTVAYDGTTGEELWVTRYDGPVNGGDAARDLVLAPDGDRLIVTGYSQGDGTGRDYTTIAYDTATGEALWNERYDGPASRSDEASAVALSPDGARVYVTGWSDDGPAWEVQMDFKTLAYDTASGAPLWDARWANEDGGARATTIAVDPQGGRVFVAGHGTGASGTSTYKSVAYVDLVPWLKRILDEGTGLLPP